MDFRPNTTQQPTQPANRPAESHASGETSRSGRSKRDKLPTWLRWLYIVLLFAGVIVVVGVVLLFANGSSNEASSLNKDKYQAVFLANGQVYFGSVDELSSDYIKMSGIYYLTQASNKDGTASGNYTLVKLGCQQIHYPDDAMVITRSQVTFWENLNDDGQVVKKIQEFQKQNPKGPDCSQVSNETQATGTTDTQGSSSTTNQTPTGTGTTGTGTTGTGTTNNSTTTTPKQ